MLMSIVLEFGVYQMATASLLKRVSISTRQIGQCLLVISHWSTQSIWNKCIHGKRLTSFSISNNDKHIVHFSPPSSSSSSLWRRTRLYLCGNVLRSIVSCAIEWTLRFLCFECNHNYFSYPCGTPNASLQLHITFLDDSHKLTKCSQTTWYQWMSWMHGWWHIFSSTT